MNEPSKTIAFCIEALTVGGAEQMLVAMANQFVHRGWQVHMICLTKAGELAQQLDPAVELHVLNKRSGIDISLPGKLRALIKGIKPLAVNSHLWTANLWTRIALLRAGLPIIVTEHSRDFWKSPVHRVLDRVLVRGTKKLVAVSNDTADFYRTQIRIPASLIQVINNGVDTQRYAAGDGTALKKQWAPNAQLLIGTVGRMVPAKNHLRLMDTAALLRKRLPAYKVVFVGDGELSDQMETAVKDKGLDDIVFLAGARSDIPDVLAAFDLFVLSSDREGHPLTALEAQAAGTPVVLTDAGGSADAIAMNEGQKGGLLVEKDSGALADAITSLLADNSALDSMSAFAQAYALEHFDLQHMVDQYEQLFVQP